ncbi:MAG TPA: family 1 glycosylhydrolase [Chthoniobacterales bacterium]|nr:family 1 glycosylhydrolase [Chthoniobacterales bacterium]
MDEREFLWGVATSAYQSEGGYNGPGEPQTNWATAERCGDVAPVSKAAEFWTRFREDFAVCRDLGLNAFRLGIEWSRVQPTTGEAPSRPPPFDHTALDHYVGMLAECRDAGLEPVVTLHHFVHPAWLGPDAWLDAGTSHHFTRYVDECVTFVNQRLVDAHGLAPIRYYITINEPNMLVLNTYLGNQFPSSAASGMKNLLRAYTNLLVAHTSAYNLIHDVYEQRGWPTPMVTFNNYCSDLYWSDRVWLDLISARVKGIARADITKHIGAKAREFTAAFKHARIRLHRDLPYYFGALIKTLSNWAGRRFFDADAIAPLLDAIYASPRPRLIDYLGLDYYDPFAAHAFRLPVWWDHEFKNRSFHAWIMNSITSKWWDWRVLPRGLQFFCENYSSELGLPVLIAENGMALRRRPEQRHATRRDRMTRSQFLRLHVHEVTRIRNRGVPLIGYLHWSLFDNYEWGTYTPRFGLFSIDYAAGTERLVEDHFGDRPSETYARLIAEARGTFQRDTR